jgi:hypothetical protein
MVTAGNKKPVRPWRPILTPLSQGVAPDYSGTAHPGLTKPVSFNVRPSFGRIKVKLSVYNINNINYIYFLSSLESLPVGFIVWLLVYGGTLSGAPLARR